jgi:Integron-associated effector binding protein
VNEYESPSASAIPPIRRILPFEDRFRIFQMPAVRLVGRSIRDTLYSNPSPCPSFWSEYFARGFHLVTDSLPRAIPNRMAWFGEYSPETNQYTYMICVACPAGTPVPDGFEYRDVPAALVAHGATNETGGDAYSAEGLDAYLQEQGFTRVDEGWCEFYPDLERASFCVLFTCMQIEGNAQLGSLDQIPWRSGRSRKGAPVRAIQRIR